MTVLLDAHALLWFLWDDPQLSSAAKAAIESERRLKLVSIATCWEITIKTSLGKLDLGEAAASFLTREIQFNGFSLLPLTLGHVTTVERLPFHHRDPFDRILIAQAQDERLAIVSADAAFDAYGVHRIW